jgi:hypothetical protein
MSRFVPLVVVAAACSAHTTPETPCSAASLGLAHAQLVPWTPPAGCAVQRPLARVIVRSQAELEAMFHCPAGVAPQLDFSQSTLVIATWQMSPAAFGMDAFDDGNQVTFVQKVRDACPNEQPPASVTMTSYFVISRANAQRHFNDSSCTTSELGCTTP